MPVAVGSDVGTDVGVDVGFIVGLSVDNNDGFAVGSTEGDGVAVVSFAVGFLVVGLAVGDDVGDGVAVKSNLMPTKR